MVTWLCEKWAGLSITESTFSLFVRHTKKKELSTTRIHLSFAFFCFHFNSLGVGFTRDGTRLRLKSKFNSWNDSNFSWTLAASQLKIERLDGTTNRHPVWVSIYLLHDYFTWTRHRLVGGQCNKCRSRPRNRFTFNCRIIYSAHTLTLYSSHAFFCHQFRRKTIPTRLKEHALPAERESPLSVFRSVPR